MNSPRIAEVKLERDCSIDKFYIGYNKYSRGDIVIVETEHGKEVGFVLDTFELKERKRYKRVLKRVEEKELEKYKKKRKREIEDFPKVKKIIEDAGLDMKLIKINYTFDNKKLFIYYTSEGRVDFRELLKVLAREFKRRIQMVQIGVRDETKIVGGIGVCGRILCCSSFLRKFESIVVDFIKIQNLSANVEKLMGVCGRLMCCLYYEVEMYKELLKGIPSIGEEIETPEGRGKVIEIRPFMNEVRVKFENDTYKVFSFDEVRK